MIFGSRAPVAGLRADALVVDRAGEHRGERLEHAGHSLRREREPLGPPLDVGPAQAGEGAAAELEDDVEP